jgi:uncharacterized protein
MSMMCGEVLGRKPNSSEWPRWNRVLDNIEHYYHMGFDAHYVLNGNGIGDRDWPFCRCLRQFRYWPDAPKGFPPGSGGDPVDDFIRREIDRLSLKICGGPNHVVVVAHDGGYAPHLRHLLDGGGRVTIVGFREKLAKELIDLETRGGEFLDIEHDLGAFDYRLDRPYSPDRLAS